MSTGREIAVAAAQTLARNSPWLVMKLVNQVVRNYISQRCRSHVGEYKADNLHFKAEIKQPSFLSNSIVALFLNHNHACSKRYEEELILIVLVIYYEFIRTI